MLISCCRAKKTNIDGGTDHPFCCTHSQRSLFFVPLVRLVGSHGIVLEEIELLVALLGTTAFPRLVDSIHADMREIENSAAPSIAHRNEGGLVGIAYVSALALSDALIIPIDLAVKTERWKQGK